MEAEEHNAVVQHQVRRQHAGTRAVKHEACSASMRFRKEKVREELVHVHVKLLRTGQFQLAYKFFKSDSQIYVEQIFKFDSEVKG